MGRRAGPGQARQNFPALSGLKAITAFPFFGLTATVAAPAILGGGVGHRRPNQRIARRSRPRPVDFRPPAPNPAAPFGARTLPRPSETSGMTGAPGRPIWARAPPSRCAMAARAADMGAVAPFALRHGRPGGRYGRGRPLRAAPWLPGRPIWARLPPSRCAMAVRTADMGAGGGPGFSAEAEGRGAGARPRIRPCRRRYGKHPGRQRQKQLPPLHGAFGSLLNRSCRCPS